MADYDYEIAIVGAGIVGSTLASFLAPHARGKLALVDRDVRGLPGSTGHAPGFVGQLNALAPLTTLAQRSVEHYLSIEGGFDVVGGLEVARTRDELMNLAQRAALASSHGVEASIISADDAASLAPAFIAPDSAVRALHFPTDGTANARTLAHAGQDAAAAAGAKLIDADVTAITRSDAGTFSLTTSQGAITAKTVVVCTGVWAGQLLPSLHAAAVSVAHPYAYSSPRATRAPSPFIRWPATHVYARDHGARDGIGSYAHDPVHVGAQAMSAAATAYGKWEEGFTQVIDAALELLPPATAQGFAPVTPTAAPDGSDAPYAFNGLFTVTPDGMPLVGALEKDLYCAVGVWVTHAGGSARLLADIILEDLGMSETAKEDGHGCGHGHAHDHNHGHGHGAAAVTDASLREGMADAAGDDSALRKALNPMLRKAVDPMRFVGKDDKTLEAAALASYNDIYNKDKA
jgi:sarcosine oxidase